MKRQVVLLTEESGVGGVQTTLSLLTSALSARGWQVTRLSVRQGRPSLWACWQAARRAQVLVASNNFWPAYWAVALGWLSGRPSVVWVHGPLHEVLQQAGASRRKTRWLQTVYRLASLVVCASQTSLDSFRRVIGEGGEGGNPDAFGVPDALGLSQVVCVIRNPAVVPGTGTDRTLPNTSPAASNRPCLATEAASAGDRMPDNAVAQDLIPLGFVGRLSPEKQPLQLVAMLQQLPAVYHLHVVGDGALMGAMQSAGQSLMAQGRLHLHGQQTVTAQTYRAWRATVLCSLYEGYPMTALESMACGVPCVSTPIPAMQEMLGPHAPQWLAHDHSALALADAVQACLAQSPEALQAALQATVATHGFEAFAQAWDRVLSRLVQRGWGQGAGPQHQHRHTPWPKRCPRPEGQAMSTVHFVHGTSSYLPELAAYTRHIRALGHTVQLHASAQTVPDAAEAVWWICGRVPADQARRLKAAVQVHEYASASVAPLAWIKDRVKQWQHPVPDFRVFQSEWVRQRMGFRDAVPYALRDMGVPDHFLTAQAVQSPEFDAVYLGEMSRLLHFLPLLQTLNQAGITLLLVGDVPAPLQAALSGWAHIQCTGRVPQAEVPLQLLRARCGLNLMPDVLPLSEQTSTKMLEYLAVGLPVISNPYAWAQRTSLMHPGRVQFVNVAASAQSWQQAVQQVPALQTDRRHLLRLSWPAQLQHLPVWSALFGDTP